MPIASPEALIVQYLPVAKAVAARYAQRYPKIERDDFVSAAYMGMCEAARLFDASKGYSFAPYARRWCQWGCAAVVRDPTHDARRVSYDEYDRGEDPDTQKKTNEFVEHPQESADHRAILLVLQQNNIPQGQELVELLLSGYSEKEIILRLDMSEDSFSKTLVQIKEALLSLGIHSPHAPRLIRYLNTTDYAKRTKIPLKSIYTHLSHGAIEAKKSKKTWIIPVTTDLFESTPQGPMIPHPVLGQLIGLRGERWARRSIERVIRMRRNPLNFLLRANKNTGGRPAQEYLVPPSLAIQVIKQSRTSQGKRIQQELKSMATLPAQEQLVRIARKMEMG